MWHIYSFLVTHRWAAVHCLKNAGIMKDEKFLEKKLRAILCSRWWATVKLVHGKRREEADKLCDWPITAPWILVLYLFDSRFLVVHPSGLWIFVSYLYHLRLLIFYLYGLRCPVLYLYHLRFTILHVCGLLILVLYL